MRGETWDEYRDRLKKNTTPVVNPVVNYESGVPYKKPWEFNCFPTYEEMKSWGGDYGVYGALEYLYKKIPFVYSLDGDMIYISNATSRAHHFFEVTEYWLEDWNIKYMLVYSTIFDAIAQGDYTIQEFHDRIDWYHSKGIKVHLWVNMFHIRNTEDTCDWMSPESDQAVARINTVLGFITDNPTLDGLHLDSIRYCGVTGSCCNWDTQGHTQSEAMEIISNVVGEIRERLPDKYALSAAVKAAGIDEPNIYGQDIAEFAKYCDFLNPMTYYRDVASFTRTRLISSIEETKRRINGQCKLSPSFQTYDGDRTYRKLDFTEVYGDSLISKLHSGNDSCTYFVYQLMVNHHKYETLDLVNDILFTETGFALSIKGETSYNYVVYAGGQKANREYDEELDETTYSLDITGDYHVGIAYYVDGSSIDPGNYIKIFRKPLLEAPKDGKIYGRKDGEWIEIN